MLRCGVDSNCSLQAQLRLGRLSLVQEWWWSANSCEGLETTSFQKNLVSLCFLLFIYLILLFHAPFPLALYRKLVNILFSYQQQNGVANKGNTSEVTVSLKIYAYIIKMLSFGITRTKYIYRSFSSSQGVKGKSDCWEIGSVASHFLLSVLSYSWNLQL